MDCENVYTAVLTESGVEQISQDQLYFNYDCSPLGFFPQETHVFGISSKETFKHIF